MTQKNNVKFLIRERTPAHNEENKIIYEADSYVDALKYLKENNQDNFYIGFGKSPKYKLHHRGNNHEG